MSVIKKYYPVWLSARSPGALQTPDGGAGASPADNWALKLLRQAKYSTAGLAISLNQIYSDHSPASRH